MMSLALGVAKWTLIVSTLAVVLWVAGAVILALALLAVIAFAGAPFLDL